MPTAIGELATEQSQATQSTMEKLSQLLNYCAAHPDATVRFTASDMILAVESDASYLSVVEGRSRAAGYFLLTNKLNLSLSLLMTLVRVFYYPRGSRSVIVASQMTSPRPIARATQYLAHNLCSSPFER
jgi:hypothetical protein